MASLRPSLAISFLLPALVAAPPQAHGLSLSSLDRRVAPGDDFFAHANGAWLDSSMPGVMGLLWNLTNERVAALIQAAAASKAPIGSDRRKLGDYYTSLLNEPAIEAKGLKPLRPTLKAIAAISNRQALARQLGAMLATKSLFDFGVSLDPDDSNRYVPFLDQGRLGMPDRSYYLEDSKDMAFIRTQYLEHVTVLLKLAGLPDPEAHAARVLDLETRLAQVHISQEETRDVLKGNNHWSQTDFTAKAPGLDWEAFFAAAKLQGSKIFVVWQPTAFTGLSALTSTVPLETWKDYLVFHALQHRAQVLPRAVSRQSDYFNQKVLAGASSSPKRWMTAVDQTNRALGDVVGKAYVAHYFPPADKASIRGMVSHLKAAFRSRIERLDWMAPATKAKALAKLEAMQVGVGNPDHWQNYSGLKIVAGDAFGNAERAEHFRYACALRKLGRPVNRAEWNTTPQTVNAYYQPGRNALYLPAAFLQPPMFDPTHSDAINYGAIGTVIGHEISHGFDDMGAHFDATGTLRNWWTPQDLRHFQDSGQHLVKQYDAYLPLPDLHVNGSLTLGENIADLAGLAAAYDAYHFSLNGHEAPLVQGFTGDQQFFLSFAQMGRADATEASLRKQIHTDPHAPNQYRVNTVRNFDAWYTAFQVKPGQALYLTPAERVRIW